MKFIFCLLACFVDSLQMLYGAILLTKKKPPLVSLIHLDVFVVSCRRCLSNIYRTFVLCTFTSTAFPRYQTKKNTILSWSTASEAENKQKRLVKRDREGSQIPSNLWMSHWVEWTDQLTLNLRIKYQILLPPSTLIQKKRQNHKIPKEETYFRLSYKKLCSNALIICQQFGTRENICCLFYPYNFELDGRQKKMAQKMNPNPNPELSLSWRLKEKKKRNFPKFTFCVNCALIP